MRLLANLHRATLPLRLNMLCSSVDSHSTYGNWALLPLRAVCGRLRHLTEISWQLFLAITQRASPL